MLARNDGAVLPIAIADEARLVFVTLHRRESFGPVMEGMARAIRDSARASGPGVHFLLPVHPNPNVARAFGDIFAGTPNVSLTSPLDYRTTAHVLARCRFVVTDSGGLQEEAPSIGKPVLVLRDVTERPEGVEAGTALLVGTNPARIEEWIRGSCTMTSCIGGWRPQSARTVTDTRLSASCGSCSVHRFRYRRYDGDDLALEPTHAPRGRRGEVSTRA